MSMGALGVAGIADNYLNNHNWITYWKKLYFPIIMYYYFMIKCATVYVEIQLIHLARSMCCCYSKCGQ